MPTLAGLSVAANTKLGPGVYGWSIPAETTCPGASSLCRLVCYAMSGHFIRPAVVAKHEQNWQVSKSPSFVGDMVAQIRVNQIRVMRVGVAGDFYSAGYVRKWIAIVRRCRTTAFFGYTRSWRIPAILPALQVLAAERNFQLWLSADRDTGVPPAIPNTATAWMAMDDDDLPPPGCDLVFRVRSSTTLKHMGGVLVCPPEQGVELPAGGHITCTRCGICYRKNKLEKVQHVQTGKAVERSAAGYGRGSASEVC